MYQNLGGGFVMKKLLLGFIFICACTTTYAYPKDINITKSEGAYIRGNFTTLFGKNSICQNIGRTYVNYPDIYDGKRADLNKALLNLIKKGGNYIPQGSQPEGSDPYIGEVGYWYFNNCKLFPSGIRKIKALDYFYGHMMYFEEED